MRLLDLLYEAYHALSVNRMRSILTILGIVIGISSVITMTSLVGGVESSITSGVGGNQSRVVLIYPLVEATRADFEELERQMPEYEAIVLAQTSNATLQYQSKTFTPSNSLNGVDYRYAEARSLKLASGKFFGQIDEAQAARALVVGKGVAKALFGNEESPAVGREVTLESDTYVIYGVIDGNASSENYNAVYMPLSTMQERLGDNGYYMATGVAKEGLDKEGMVRLSEKTAEVFTRILGGREPQDTVQVASMSQILDQLSMILGGFSLLLGGVAAISLLVGGIGIMNMMLTNVTERIREIGLRKALGAHRKDIVRQFLLEAVALTAVGGLVGILFGYLGSWSLATIIGFVNPALSFSPAVNVTSVAIAVGVSVLIGIGFGYYPARRAAKLDPIEALRYQ